MTYRCASMSVLAPVFLACLASLSAEAADSTTGVKPPAWTQESVAMFARLAVQDEGRIKPVDTYARFKLLKFSGAKSLRLETGRRTATEWLMDCLFAPEIADQYKLFLVESGEAMDALGLPHENKRDRYSFRALEPGLQKLYLLAQQYSRVDPKERSVVESQLVNLFHNIYEYKELTQGPRILALIPPARPDTVEWMTQGEMMQGTVAAEDIGPDQTRLSSQVTALTAAKANPLQLQQSLQAVASTQESLASARGEYGRIGLEVFYYNLSFAGFPVFYTLTLILYVLGFLSLAVLWMRPNSRGMALFVPLFLCVPTLLLVWGITLRCLIRMRPPVTTLYETILFITAVAVVVCLAIEYMNRQKIALSLASVLGALGLFIAHRYEVMEGSDTMPSMIAVLDTNFWLSTHVTTITIGYAAGLLAGAIAHVFVFAKLLGLRRDDPEYFRTITRMVYGVTCFGLFFSMLGTVLGGIWANESWGRFWGWDPKENGALLICLWGLLMLHARLGGYIRDYGMNLAAIVGGMIVAFSWFGVNLLGVGLHSYGFTNGTFTGLVIFYAIETFVLLLGIAAWMWELGQKAPRLQPDVVNGSASAPAKADAGRVVS